MIKVNRLTDPDCRAFIGALPLFGNGRSTEGLSKTPCLDTLGLVIWADAGAEVGIRVAGLC